MIADNRLWTVLLEVDSEGKVAATVTANGRTLLPALNDEVPEQALGYVEAALVDVQPGDTVDCTVQCEVASAQRYKVASAAIALLWLAETLLSATRIAKLARGTRCEKGASSQTRVKAIRSEDIQEHKRRTQ